MSILNGSSGSGTHLSLLAILAVTLCSASSAFAETVATVNGAAIDSAVVDMYLESRTQQPAAQATPEQRDAILQELKDIYLLTTQARANELAKDPAVQAQIELQSRGVLAQAVATDFFAENAASEAEIQAQYQAMLTTSPAQQFKARHILVETQAAAQDLIGQLDKGADFQELAKAHSTGPSGPNGGDLGWFSPDQMVKPFSDAVSKMENGQYTSQPVQTQFGWHVILREDSRDNEPPTMESVHDALKQRVEQTKFQAYIEKLRAESAATN
jgi:peptidyl-prolyl cis-trans isomerase C